MSQIRARDARTVDVMGIGVQKAATTWLFQCLAEHPGVRPASADGKFRKELNFFNHDYEKGYGWYHRDFQFGSWKTAEFSVLYFHDRNVPPRVHEYNPDVRLVLALRDPADRAWSHHRHEIAQGRWRPERGDFWQALSENPAYLELGTYATHLERWLRAFRLEQIHIIDYERVRREPKAVLAELFEFLEVDPTFRPSVLSERVYTSTVPSRPTIDQAVRLSASTLRSLFGSSTVRKLRETRIVASLREANRTDLAKVIVPSDSDRARLVALFQLEIERLENILAWDLSHWKR